MKNLFYPIIAGVVMAGMSQKCKSQSKKHKGTFQPNICICSAFKGHVGVNQYFKYVDTAFIWDNKIRVIIGKKSFTIDRSHNWQIDSVNVVYDRTKKNKVKYSRIDTIIISH